MNAAVNSTDFLHALPILVMAGWAMVVLLADALGRSRSSRTWPLATLGLLSVLGVTVWSWAVHPSPANGLFGGMLVVDRFALFLDGVVTVAALITVLLAEPYMKGHRFAFAEMSSLVMLITTGMMILVHAADFVVLVIGLETMSLGVYALVASWKGNGKSAEAGFKYFIMGAVASAFLLYGIALLYGATGYTNMYRMATEGDRLAGNPLFLMGMFMVLGGMGFKVALVPFHGWTPDVYEGAPTPVTGFMAVAVKAAGFGVLLRVFMVVFGNDAFVFGSTGWANLFWVLAVLTMTLGNLAALRQTNIKRMLAYSSISHAGYILVGVVAMGVLPAQQAGPVLYYLLAYTFTTLGAFGMVAWLGGFDREHANLEDFHGLGKSHPAAALALTLFMLSLGGIPPTAGFFAKFYIFKAALGHDNLLSLVVIAALNSVVSIAYYLRPVVAMYFEDRPAGQPAPAPLQSGAQVVALTVAAILVLLLGLLPGQAMNWADLSLLALVP